MALPDGEPQRRARLVLVVTGNEVEPARPRRTRLRPRGRRQGVVVAGPTARRRRRRAARRRRRSGRVATVDGTETSAGRVAAVLALVHVLTDARAGRSVRRVPTAPVPLG